MALREICIRLPKCTSTAPPDRRSSSCSRMFMADPGLLDLIENLAEWSRSPLRSGPARPYFLELRPRRKRARIPPRSRLRADVRGNAAASSRSFCDRRSPETFAAVIVTRIRGQPALHRRVLAHHMETGKPSSSGGTLDERVARCNGARPASLQGLIPRGSSVRWVFEAGFSNERRSAGRCSRLTHSRARRRNEAGPALLRDGVTA